MCKWRPWRRAMSRGKGEWDLATEQVICLWAVDPVHGAERREGLWDFCILKCTSCIQDPPSCARAMAKVWGWYSDLGAWKGRGRLIGWEIHEGQEVVVWRYRAWKEQAFPMLGLWEEGGGLVEESFGGQGQFFFKRISLRLKKNTSGPM